MGSASTRRAFEAKKSSLSDSAWIFWIAFHHKFWEVELPFCIVYLMIRTNTYFSISRVQTRGPGFCAAQHKSVWSIDKDTEWKHLYLLSTFWRFDICLLWHWTPPVTRLGMRCFTMQRSRVPFTSMTWWDWPRCRDVEYLVRYAE